ncbi:hypothetical protein ES707_06045 [subsurface metagenome]
MVAALVELRKWPGLTNDGLVVVPEEPRKQAERAIETAANMIAIAEGCKRSISSPIPCIAFLPEDSESHAWLDRTKGILSSRQLLSGAKFRVKLDETIQKSLQGRLDGVQLLAEALSHTHATGKFHEFLRLFERAFRCSKDKLAMKLAEFLEPTGQGYTKAEIKKYVVHLRDPATHADKKPEFVLESDIRPVIRRMEQAAYDVLFNKAEWRSSSTGRRKIWSPPAGTASNSHHLFVVQGSEVALEFQLLDDFDSYPVDLSVSINVLPEGWWSKNAGSLEK